MSNALKLLFLVIGAAVIAILVRVVILNASHHGPAPVQTSKIRVSAGDLPQGLLLRDDDLRWQDTPADKVPAGAIVENASGAVDLKGALLRHPVAGGTVIVANDVIMPNAPGFLAATLKPDMRAVSVAVDDVSGNAGLIEPGDYVDLLLTQQLDQKTNSPDRVVSSETVVEHVRVLASGSDISRPNVKDDGTASRPERVRTVTLEVTPRMGEVIAVAARLGSLSLELRSFATVTRAGGPTAGLLPAATDNTPRPPVWAGDVSRALRDLSVPRTPTGPSNVAVAPMPRMVAIYRGSQRSDATPADSMPGGAGGGGGIPPLPSTVSGPR